mmetsp:Transcript_6431/g.22940  ORF Transcript_6431/g.22940 Transcript_6431/m.22940 type:complete len:237 (+) Transcript_6431:1147-1857(+)
MSCVECLISALRFCFSSSPARTSMCGASPASISAGFSAGSTTASAGAAGATSTCTAPSIVTATPPSPTSSPPSSPPAPLPPPPPPSPPSLAPPPSAPPPSPAALLSPSPSAPAPAAPSATAAWAASASAALASLERTRPPTVCVMLKVRLSASASVKCRNLVTPFLAPLRSPVIRLRVLRASSACRSAERFIRYGMKVSRVRLMACVTTSGVTKASSMLMTPGRQPWPGTTNDSPI